MNKKIRLIFSILGMMAFGFFSAALTFNSHLNQKYEGLVHVLDLVSFPAKVIMELVQAILGGGDGYYILPYLYLSILYLAAIGFFLSCLLYSLIHLAVFSRKN